MTCLYRLTVMSRIFDSPYHAATRREGEAPAEPLPGSTLSGSRGSAGASPSLSIGIRVLFVDRSLLRLIDTATTRARPISNQRPTDDQQHATDWGDRSELRDPGQD